jgi:hypothetical protein
MNSTSSEAVAASGLLLVYTVCSITLSIISISVSPDAIKPAA